MSHELEFFNGTASFAGREPAWHGLGTVVEDLSYADAMTLAGLNDWNVRAEPLVAHIDGQNYEMPGQVIVRNNPGTGKVEPIAPVGGRYHTVQNEQAFAVAEFLEDLGATVETAGSIRGGRQVFLSLAMEKGFIIDPEGAADRMVGYLLLRTAHDGSLSVEACSTLVRVVCANTFDMAVGDDTPRAYKIRHTATAEGRLADAQQAFLMANGYMAAVAEEANALYQTEATSAEFFEIVNRVYPKPGTPESGVEESKRGLTVWSKKLDTLQTLFTGQTSENIAGTVWAAQQAMTERLDWYRKARGGDGTSLLEAASGFVPNITAEKERIREVTVEFAREKNPAAFATV